MKKVTWALNTELRFAFNCPICGVLHEIKMRIFPILVLTSTIASLRSKCGDNEVCIDW